MKISARTKQILKNFAAINQNIILNEGSKIRTISSGKTVYAEAEVEETFPSEFLIYDLNEFLGVVGLFEDPELLFEGNILNITNGKTSVRFHPAEPSVIIAPKKALVLGEPTSTFKLESASLNSALKAAGVLKAPTVTFKGDGTAISMIVHDKGNDNSNNFSVEIAENDTQFEYHVKVEYLSKLLSEEFDVKIQPNKLLVFQGDSKLYMIAADNDSTAP